MDETQSSSKAGAGEDPGPAPAPVAPWPRAAAHWLDSLPAGSARIGRFTVLERIAAGGMGVVYAAYDSELDRKVAIKVLQDGSTSETVHARIVREARAMAKLSHPNVAQVFEVGAHLGSTFIAMEFVHGVTLRQWQQEHGRSWQEVLAVYVQAGRGLAAAHAEGLVHRDFKPDNAMIGRDGRVRVLDFGLVRVNDYREASRKDEDDRVDSEPEGDALATQLTKSGSMLGTPGYMAPEQFLGVEVDPRTDQFGFCVSLWEALLGERPFTGRTRAELIANVIAGRTRREPKGNDVPTWVKAVLLRGLAAEPSQRFGSMSGLLAALEADPTRRNRRLLAAAAGASAVVLGIGGFVMDRAQRVQACEDEAASIAEVWDDGARERVQASLLGTGASFASSTWERVAPRLDEYAAAWSEAREQTCLAAQVEGTRTEDLATRTSDCLTEHRDAFASLVDLFSAADARVVQEAAALSARLPPLAECTNDVKLARRMQAPADPDLRERVAEIRKRFATTSALNVAGRFDEGLAQARESAVEAERVGWAPLHAEALWRVGVLATRAGKPDVAEQVLEQAMDLALREGDDDLAVRAAGVLARVTGTELGRHERGIWWARLGLAIAARGRDGLDDRTVEINGALARIHALKGAYAEAKTFLERALALNEQSRGPDHPDFAATLIGLGGIQIEMGEYAEARASYERALAITEAALGPDHPYVAICLTSIGNSHVKAGEFAAARKLYERALALDERAVGPEHPQTIVTRSGLAHVHMALGEHAEAKAIFERELAIREKTLGPEHAEYGFVLFNLAWVHGEMGAPATAKALGERALSILEKALGPDHPGVAEALSGLANTHAQLGAYAQAKLLFERAIAIGEQSLGADHPFLAYPLSGLAAAALGLGTPVEAVAPAERAFRILEVAEVDPEQRVHIRFTLAKALWASGGDRERALALARQAAAEATEPARREAIEAWLRGVQTHR